MGVINSLRAANVERCREWEKGVDPGNCFYAVELGGEAGEVLNEVKKLEREALGMVGSRSSKAKLAEELADVVICADLLAIRYGIDLADAIAEKFNATTDKNGLSTYLHPDNRII